MMSYDFSFIVELQLDKICFLADFDLYGDIQIDVGDIVSVEVEVWSWYLAEALFMCLSRAAVGEDGLLAAIVGITKEMAPISVITYPTASTASGLLQAVKQEGDREKQVETKLENRSQMFSLGSSGE